MNVLRVLAIVFAVGIALFLGFFGRPHFHDAAHWPWVPYVEDADTEGFVAVRERNRTIEGRLADVGLGIATLAFSLAVAVVLSTRHAAGRAFSTPSRKWVIVVFANVSILAVYYGEWLALARDQVRGEFPPWADSMAIPMAALISGWQRAAPIVTVALVVCLWSARLPVSLWRRPAGWWAWTSTLVIGAAVALAALSLAEAVQYGRAFAIPGYVFLLYCLLCARAAAASRRALAR